MYTYGKSYKDIDDGWMKIMNKIPYLTFPTGCEVQIIPPFYGAVARFRIRRADTPLAEISVYLDWYGNLGGSPDTPYWEIYLTETERFGLNETDKMMERIGEILGCK